MQKQPQKSRFGLCGILAGVLVVLPLMTAAMAQNSQPIDISADTALEWDRQNNRYIARGHAVATQGDTTLKADQLIAGYDTEGEGGATDLTEITAEQNVEIINGTNILYGDQGRYDLTTGIARLTGDALRMQSERAEITASDYFEYDAANARVTAMGNAVVLQGDDRLETRKLIAHMIKNDAGETVVETLEAPEAVTIITPKERITGNRGTYHMANEIAILTGNVKITQGENILIGERAEVNTATGMSRLFAPRDADGLPGRVRGVFYPKSNEE